MSQQADVSRIAELEADNRRLRRLLDAHGAPGELRHRLRNTIAILRVIIRSSAETERDFDGYVAHLEDRLDALMRVQATTDEHGAVELSAVLAEELHQYMASEGERLFLTGPEILFAPRAGQVLALAIHELAVNAVEHGALGGSVGQVEISWSVAGEDDDASLTLVWKESGGDRIHAPSRNGFGSEVLTRTLPYELRAETILAFEPDGLRCTLLIPLASSVA